MTENNAGITATISGSFNKYLDQIRQKIQEFEKAGIRILSPRYTRPISCRDHFIILESDKGTPVDIELNHLAAISQSDFLYVVNPAGYIGKSVSLEIGYALSRDIPVYSLETPKDYLLSLFIKPEKSIDAIKKAFRAHLDTPIEKLPETRSPTLTELQDYVRCMVKRRGFEKETIKDVLLLFVEEVGELAREIRSFTDLKVSGKPKDNLRQELADCLIYLIDLANLSNIELGNAVREKEKINSGRKWRSRKA